MITCLLCQRLVSLAVDANTVSSEWARQHAQRCPTCRTFYESVTTMAQQLAVSANAERRPPSPFLYGKIMSAIRADGKVKARPAHGRLSWAITLGAACLVLITCIVAMRQPTTSDQNISRFKPLPGELTLKVSFPIAAHVDEWTKALEGFLENETQLVLDDVKAAINSLENSLLPESLLVPGPERTVR